jgi:hypothetical protein
MRRRFSGFPLHFPHTVTRHGTELPLSVHYNPHYTSFEQPRGFPRRLKPVLSLFCNKGFERNIPNAPGPGLPGTVSPSPPITQGRLHWFRIFGATIALNSFPGFPWSTAQLVAQNTLNCYTATRGIQVSTEAGSSSACRCRLPHLP